MKLHLKYGQSFKLIDTAEVLDNCHPFGKEISALVCFFVSLIEKRDEK
ncbi:MAG TPA: hypothetical protein VLR29_06005 [Flavobacterium sp.]|nr:hypothetical protein [Flavobacterium sp.]